MDKTDLNEVYADALALVDKDHPDLSEKTKGRLAELVTASFLLQDKGDFDGKALLAAISAQALSAAKDNQPWAVELMNRQYDRYTELYTKAVEIGADPVAVLMTNTGLTRPHAKKLAAEVAQRIKERQAAAELTQLGQDMENEYPGLGQSIDEMRRGDLHPADDESDES